MTIITALDPFLCFMFSRLKCLCYQPVVCVVVLGAGSGVDIISDQPVEVLVGADTNVLHVFLGDVRAVCVEVAQDHHVLQKKR